MSGKTPSTPAPGDILDQKYELRAHIGRGASGSVFLARHIYMEREVAIKLLHPAFVTDKKLRYRFLREAKLTSRLQHPNIVMVHDYGVSDDVPYLVMEYVQGVTLRSVLREKKTLSAEEVRAIGIQVSRALAAAHGLGIVHRDLKPDNVLLMNDGESRIVKVLDFGVAKLFVSDGAQAGSESVVTKYGAFQGTPKYAPAEQLRGEPVDARADVYAFGVTLYESLVGKAPFEATSLMEYAVRHVAAPIVRPRERNPAVQCSDELEALIMKCLAKRPQDRPSDGAALLYALEHLNDSHTTPIVLEPRPALGQKVGVGIAGLGTAAAVLFLLGVLIPSHGSRQHPPALAAPAPEAVPAESVTEQLDSLYREGERAYNNAEYSDAVSIFRHVLSERPEDSKAKVYLGLTLRRLERYDEAIAIFESLEPSLQNEQIVAYQLALLNAKLGRMESALKHLDTAAEDNPEIQEEAEKEPAFKPLAERAHYKRTAPKAKNVAETPPQAAPASGSTVENGFGRVLEVLNSGIKSVF